MNYKEREELTWLVVDIIRGTSLAEAEVAIDQYISEGVEAGFDYQKAKWFERRLKDNRT